MIEKVSGLSYANYVKQKLLAPLKIKRMALGYTIAKHSGETSYDSQYTGPTVLDMTGKTVAAPYGSFSMRIQDANGGWIASAPDLVRWAKMFDASSSVLNSTSLGHVWAKPETGVNADGWYYGLGWQIRPVTGGTGRNTWHTGSMPGTYTLLVRTYNGMSWAALFNRRDDTSGKSYGDIDAGHVDRRQRRQVLAHPRPLPPVLQLTLSTAVPQEQPGLPGSPAASVGGLLPAGARGCRAWHERVVGSGEDFLPDPGTKPPQPNPQLPS